MIRCMSELPTSADAPSAQGALVPRVLTVPFPAPGQLDQWRWAAEAALHFWAAVAAEAAIDNPLRRRADEAAAATRRALQRFAEA
jgi:hypothetical protein